MWAPLITARVRPGADATALHKMIREAEDPGSGLVRTIVAQDQKSPSRLYTLVVFEREDKPKRHADSCTIRPVPPKSVRASLVPDGLSDASSGAAAAGSVW